MRESGAQIACRWGWDGDFCRISMKNFEEIIAKIARENGTTPENVLREMQLAIDHAYDHHDKEAQKLWDMM